MIWATVSSQSYFSWLCRASSSLAAKNIISVIMYWPSGVSIDHLVMSMCRLFSCVVGRGCLLWPVCSVGKTLLAFALLYSVLQGQICLLLQVFLDFLCWIIEKPKEFQKNIYFCFIDYTKAFDYVDHNKLWKILKEMGIPDHLTCLLRNLYAGQEAAVRTGHGTTDWFQIGKGVCRLYIVTVPI